MENQWKNWLWKIFLCFGIYILFFTGCKKNAPPMEEDRSGASLTQIPKQEYITQKDVKDLKQASELDTLKSKSTENVPTKSQSPTPFVTKIPEPTKKVVEKKQEKQESKKEQENKPTVDILGEFKTYYGDSSTARSANIENAAKKIDGTKLQPGEGFSCHDKLAPFTKENGYQEAGAFEQGKVVKSIGGGVCQISTTLYNAVLLAELKITSRAAHSMTVSYVELSRDAAIAGEDKDLKFVNSLEHPVTIRAITKDGWLIFRIEGKETRDPDRTIHFETVILSKQEPGEDVITVDKTRGSDYSKVTQKEHIGYETELYKIVTVKGKEKERIRINRSNYKAAPKYVTVGSTKETNK